MEERIKLIMKNLECSREEAIQVIKDDEAIDKGEKMFELSKEQKKASKQARSTGTKAETERKPRERKVDNEKLALLEMLASGLTDSNIEVAFENEVKLHFNYNGSSYSVTLTKHRPPKKQVVCVNCTKIIFQHFA